MKSRLMNAECLLCIPIPKSVPSNSLLKVVVARNVTSLESSVFWFLAGREDNVFDDER